MMKACTAETTYKTPERLIKPFREQLFHSSSYRINELENDIYVSFDSKSLDWQTALKMRPTSQINKKDRESLTHQQFSNDKLVLNMIKVSHDLKNSKSMDNFPSNFSVFNKNNKAIHKNLFNQELSISQKLFNRKRSSFHKKEQRNSKNPFGTSFNAENLLTNSFLEDGDPNKRTNIVWDIDNNNIRGINAVSEIQGDIGEYISGGSSPLMRNRLKYKNNFVDAEHLNVHEFTTISEEDTDSAGGID